LASALLFLASLFVWLTFLSPRPYTTVEGDIENDYFYNSLTESQGYAVLGSAHPGRPARLAYRLLFSVFGTDTGPTLQRALNWAYAGVFVLTAGTAVWFYLYTRRMSTPWIALLALMAALTTPPALAYYNHFGSESFVVPFGLLLVGLGWTYLSSGLCPTLGRMAGIGAVGGLCLSTKLSFLPLVLPLGLALSLAAAVPRAAAVGEGDPGRVRGRRAALTMAAFWGALVFVHVLLCLPLGMDLAWLWHEDLTRTDAFPRGGSFLAQAFHSVTLLFRVDPGLVFILALAVGVLLTRAIRTGLDRRGSARAAVWEAAPRVVFVVAAFAGLVYTLAASSFMVGMFRDAGFDLRNAGPSLLLVPVLVLYAWGPHGGRSPVRGVPNTAWAVLAIVALVCSSTAFHVVRREKFLRDYARYSAAAMARFAELREPGTRVAFWEKNAGEVLGEATWRFWGNYRWYRQDSYDDVTLARFPHLTFFPLRSLGGYNPDRSIRTDAGHSAVPNRPFLISFARTLAHRTLGAWFPPRDTSNYGRAKGEPRLFVGERRGIKVSVIVYPAAQERQEIRMPRAQLLEIIEQHLGPAKCWEEDLGGMRWVIIKVLRTTTPS
jgi:hypothetical protein